MKKTPKPKSSQTKKTQPTPSINSVGHVYITGADKETMVLSCTLLQDRTTVSMTAPSI